MFSLNEAHCFLQHSVKAGPISYSDRPSAVITRTSLFHPGHKFPCMHIRVTLDFRPEKTGLICKCMVIFAHSQGRGGTVSPFTHLEDIRHTHLKAAPRVLFFLTKHICSNPFHSCHKKRVAIYAKKSTISNKAHSSVV